MSRHDGTLTVAEARGGGAEFEARLPLPTVAPGAPAAPVPGGAAEEPAPGHHRKSHHRRGHRRRGHRRAESAQHTLPGGDVSSDPSAYSSSRTTRSPPTRTSCTPARVPGFTAVGKAHTGAEARRALDRTPVDLLLLDLHLPDVHGLQLARSCAPPAITRT